MCVCARKKEKDGQIARYALLKSLYMCTEKRCLGCCVICSGSVYTEATKKEKAASKKKSRSGAA